VISKVGHFTFPVLDRDLAATDISDTVSSSDPARLQAYGPVVRVVSRLDPGAKDKPTFATALRIGVLSTSSRDRSERIHPKSNARRVVDYVTDEPSAGSIDLIKLRR